MRRRTWVAGSALVVAAAVAAGVVVWGGPGGATPGDGSDDEPGPSVETVAVVRTDLVEQDQLDGTLGYGEAAEVGLGRPGTITALPAVGWTLDRGDVVGEVDGVPVPLLVGSRPLWRVLDVGVEGPDVQVLEENLVALGHATSADLKVDERFTVATASAVKRWQKALGVEQTGVVQPTDVVVQPTPVRVADRLSRPGDPAGGPALSVTGTERRVTVALAANRQGVLAVGDPVRVELPSGDVLDASVASISDVVTPGDDMTGSPATIEVVVALADPAAAGDLSEAPVDVSYVSSQATGVLAVPVKALLALAEGGYAVERRAGAATELVAVTTGAFADGLVEVTGDIAEGDEVVVPS